MPWADVPAPIHECPTVEDDDALANAIPIGVTVSEALAWDGLVERYVLAAVYCRVAEERLR